MAATEHDNTGLYVFVFHDVEGSTEAWSADDRESLASIATLERTTESIAERHQGQVFKHIGDGSRCVFTRVDDALRAAMDLQGEITLAESGALQDISVRVGVHMGDAQHRGGDYYGHCLAVTTRIMDAGHGGQIVTSSLVANAAARHSSLGGLSLTDQGEYVLRGVRWPERLYLVSDQDGVGDQARLRINALQMDNLPTPRGSFIGRTTELARLTDSLKQHPLVTLCGPGGVGKTRLAVEAALTVADTFRHGAWLCELGDVEDGFAALPAIATSLGVQDRPGVALDDAISHYLSDREVLLVLDNCEHVLAPVTLLVQRLLLRNPSISVLATSREPLGCNPELVFDVKPLAGPADAAMVFDLASLWESPASALLLDRSTQYTEANLTDADAPILGQLCNRLDGLPLAIELAAARLRTMTPPQVLAQMDDRFQLLRFRRAPAVERHRTMENAVDWSYRLLPPIEQHVFDRLSVFAGGFTIETAREVCAFGIVDPREFLSTVMNLVEQSLVAVDDTDRDRLRMNETMRDYGLRSLERRGELDELSGRFVQHWESVVAQAGVGLRGVDEATWSDSLDIEFGNIRACYGTLRLGKDDDRLLDFLIPLYDFTLWRMRYEHGSWCVAALDRPGFEAVDRIGDVSGLATYSLWGSALIADAIRVSRRGLELERETGTRSILLRDALSSLALYLRRPDEALRYQAEWLELATESGDGFRIARAVYTRSIIATVQNDLEIARQTAAEVLELATETGNATVASWGHHATAHVLQATDHQAAVAHYERSAAIAEGVRNRLQWGLAVRELADLHARLGRRRESLVAFRDVIRHWQRADEWANQRRTFAKLARLFRTWGLDEFAAVADGVASREETVDGSQRSSTSLPTQFWHAGGDLREQGKSMSRSQAYLWISEVLDQLLDAATGD